MAVEKVSMNFATLKHLSKHSTFNPVPPTTYKSAEMLWSALLDQAYAHDRLCFRKRSVFNKTSKRLQMLAKLVYAYEDSIWKPEHAEMLSHTTKAREAAMTPNFHCQCCVENMKQVHTLEIQLQERTQCTAERGREISELESRISEKENYCSDMDRELLRLYTEINEFKARVASTDAMLQTLRESLDAKTQTIVNLQQIISNLSQPSTDSMVPLPKKQVCVSGTAQGETAATVPSPHMDNRSRATDTRGQVERTLQFTPTPRENRHSGRFQGQDSNWGNGNGWETEYAISNSSNCPERPEEFYPKHNKMERINFLLRICKEIPKYDPNVDPFTSCDIFEGHCNKYSVAPEYRMELFKLWLPTHLNQRYEAIGRMIPSNGQFHDEEERLSLLLKLATGHWDVAPDILTKFKPTIHDEPLSLCSRFEAMYRRVTMDQGIGAPQGMIRMFVEKFPYLETAIRLSAAREPSLTDAAMIIEQYRQDVLHNMKSVKVREHVPVHVKSQDERIHHAKTNPTVCPTALPLQKSGPESPEILPCPGQKGGSSIRGRSNISNFDSTQKTNYGGTMSILLGKCKRDIVKSASLAMQQFRACRREPSYMVKSPKPNMESIRCFVCARLGHIAKYCKSVSAQVQRVFRHIRCFKCGNKGHIARNCHCASNCNVSSKNRTGNRHSLNCTLGPREIGHNRVPSQSHMPYHVLRGQNGRQENNEYRQDNVLHL